MPPLPSNSQAHPRQRISGPVAFVAALVATACASVASGAG